MLGFSISLSIAYMCLNTGGIGRDAKLVPKKSKHTAVGGIHEWRMGKHLVLPSLVTTYKYTHMCMCVLLLPIFLANYYALSSFS